jgi:hypothetical protein
MSIGLLLFCEAEACAAAKEAAEKDAVEKETPLG